MVYSYLLAEVHFPVNSSNESDDESCLVQHESGVWYFFFTLGAEELTGHRIRLRVTMLPSCLLASLRKDT